jgi:hypothetical protein
MNDDGKRGIYNNDATVTSRLTQKRLTVVEGPKVHSVGQTKSLAS